MTWMSRFLSKTLTDDDIRQADVWAEIAGKDHINIERDWLASGELVGSLQTGKVNGLSYFEYLAKRHTEFVNKWEAEKMYRGKEE